MELYKRLGRNSAERQEAYPALFADEIGDNVLTRIREATNKAWVLGDDQLRDQIQAQSGRRAVPTANRGDTRSKRYRESRKSQRV